MILASVTHEAIQQVINALSLGSSYALLALGLAMVFSIIGLVNFAHGELVTIAGYVMYVEATHGVPFVFQVPSAIVAGAVAAVLMDRVVFRPLRGTSFVTLLISGFALSVLIQSIIRAAVTPRQLGVPLPNFLNGAVHAGPYVFGWIQILTTASCAAALVILLVFFRRTTSGLGMRAAAQDFQATRLMGLSSNRLIAAAFAVSGGLAGLAAVFFVSRRGIVDPGMGFTPLLKAFIAVVIGGLGSLQGAIIGGFVLAAIEVGLDASLPIGAAPFSDAFALGIVVIILYFRPQGLLSPVGEAG